MSNEEEKKCPLCAEEMDWTDQQLKPCKCGYEVCVWCWHHIMDVAEKEATEGRCPACRTLYDKDRIVGLESNFQRVTANNSCRKQKQPKAKQKTNEVRKDLSNVRVIQRKMAYIIGLPLSIADEDLLQRKDYFGQYGKVTKVSLSRTAGGTLLQFVNDTCSVYITFSKEEEAVRCIQSVHGYVLDGRLLRASFGTAKYCHAWLRNMACNNAACLYLHNIGAEEDSFGKDEIAAIHTRNRVQEIVGATQYLHKRSGNMLPAPVDEHHSNRSASAEEPVYSSSLKDVAYASVVASGDHKDGVVRSSKHMTSFVDIVGRSSNSGSDKGDASSVAEGRMLNLCSNMPSVSIDKSNHDKAEAEASDLVSLKSSTPRELYSEPFREASKLADLTLTDTNITKEQALDSQTSHEEKRKDSISSSENGSLNPSYWWHMESDSQNGNVVNNYPDEPSSIKTTCTNSVLNDGYNERRIQSLVNSDMIYKSSKSFSNEEIVAHLRRLDDDNLMDDDENSAAVENSIISNILSMDIDECDDSVLPQTVTGLFEGKDGRHGSSWNFQNSDQSRFSFANEQDSIYKPHYQVSRNRNVKPPGFSKPPPGFPLSIRTEQAVSASSGNYVTNSLSNSHYRMPSIRNLSNNSDDLIDPAIMVVGRGKSSSYNTRSNSFDEETKLWLLRQHQQQQSASATHHRHDPRFSQTSFMQQHHTTQFPSARDNYYGDLNSRLVDQNHQSYTQQQNLQQQQPKFANGYQHQLHLDEAQQVNSRNDVGLGYDKLLPGYGDYMFQMPSSGDVYTRVFGM